MAKKLKHSLVAIKIKQGQRVVERTLQKRETLRIGKNPNNDIVLYGDQYPKSMPIIQCDKNTCTLFLHTGVTGEIRYGDSVLNFQDLIRHEIIPRKNGSYTLKIPKGRSGVIHIGDVGIGFRYDGVQSPIMDEPSYSWFKATGRSLTRDMAFKSIFLVFLAFELWFGITISGIELAPEQAPQIEQVPKRFAKFVVQKPAEAAESEITSTAAAVAEQTGEQTENTQEQSTNRRERRGGAGGGNADNPAASQGLLALIGGSGESSGNSAADFLVDQGLVQELDELIGLKPLKKGSGYGRGSGSGSGDGQASGDGIDDLMNIGMDGGIDDLLSDVQQVESVGLEKKGKVNIETPGKITGSQEAVGRRSAESVMSVINSQQGRVMYTYNKYLRQNPDLRGKVSFDVTIAADGRVSNIELVESTLNNNNFIRDLMNILRRLSFEAIPQGAVTVNIPFVFNRVN